MTVDIEMIVTGLQQAFLDEKKAFVTRFLDRFSLEVRCWAREPEASPLQLKQIRGGVEVFVRCLDQLRDYSLVPSRGRPDDIFIEMLLDYGESYEMSSSIREALHHAAKGFSRKRSVH